MTENKGNLASAYADLKIDENIQNLVDVIYERTNTDMGEYWMSFMEMSNILFQNVRHIKLATWMNIFHLLVLCY